MGRHTPLKLAGLVMLGLAIPLATSSAQSRGGYGDAVFIDFAEPELEPTATPSPAPSPAVTPLPAKPLAVPIPIQSPVPAKPLLHPFDDRALDAVTQPELTLFQSESEFAGYLRRLEKIKDERDGEWSGNDRRAPAGLAQAMQDSPTCDDPEKCPEEGDKNLVVTGTRTTSSPSITNNQTAGVDEGDIVKQIGDYFLTLQDGRIFAINIKTMKLTDRIDAYRRDSDGDPIGADWYDEMLVQGDNILVTAYSYSDRATELSVFRLDQASGRISRRGVFLISSDDYYSARNYASRVVGDKLVLYSPYDLNALQDREDRPVIRRWLPEAERKNRQLDGVPLIDAKRIYWPVMRTSDPSIHTVTVCPLDNVERRDLKCNTTGFVAPQSRRMFVSPKAVYLWTTVFWEAETWSLDPCAEEGQRPPRADAAAVPPGVVYRIPVDGSDPGVLPVRGMVFDQFSMDENNGRFRALSSWVSDRCDGNWSNPAEVSLLDVPINRFGQHYAESNGREFRPLPSPDLPYVENRFVDDWLIYGGRSGYGGYPPDEEDGVQNAKAIAVPLKSPQRVQVLNPGHSFLRIERVGNDVMMSGYHDDSGLLISLVKLGSSAALAGQAKLEGRYESEGRSHAFNSTMDELGDGLMGIPTVTRTRESGRWWSYSNVSDVNFLAFAKTGELASLGAVLGRPEDEVNTAEDYDCEVSCIDWYGNSRPIFTMGRVFALMATDLVELSVREGKVTEIKRVDLTGPLSRN